MKKVLDETEKYSALCEICKESITFKINPNKFTVSGKCKNNHIIDNASLHFFCADNIAKTRQINLFCYRCYANIEEDQKNYKCGNCCHIFCNKCINIHLMEAKHKNKIPYINSLKLCQNKNHNDIYESYCINCNQNICKKCRRAHKSHEVISYTNIIPNQNYMEKVYEAAKEYDNKIQLIIDDIKDFHEKLMERYNNLLSYLKFLKEYLIGKLINKFNNKYFDYNNYQNFKYCYTFLNQEKIFQGKRYINYIINNEPINEQIDEMILDKDSTKKKEQKKIDNNNSYEKLRLKDLRYFKDNIFFNSNKLLNTITFYELKTDNFQLLFKFCPSKLRISTIHSIKPAKYSNKLLVNFSFRKNVKILEFDVEKKTLNISKLEVKIPKEILDIHFTDCIEDSNGFIITSDRSDITKWEPDEFIPFPLCSAMGNYKKLINCNKNCFAAENSSGGVSIFSHKDLSLINDIKLNNLNYYIFFGVINEEILVIRTWEEDFFILIDLNYYEIVTKIEYVFQDRNSIVMGKNYIIQAYQENNLMVINKMKYEKNNFDKEKIITNININERTNFDLYLTDQDYFLLNTEENLYIFKY